MATVRCENPTRIYPGTEQPAVDSFVAGFIGSPAMNIKTVPLTDYGAAFAEMILPLTPNKSPRPAPTAPPTCRSVFRPEDRDRSSS